ncbi:MAG: EF-P 5-aminopentanol modification-associated protein YfmH, partial [Planctomycetota bacterium]
MNSAGKHAWLHSRSERLREEIFTATFPSGFRAHFLPKRGFQKKTAALGIRFGSVDGAFIPPGKKAEISAPAGLAHFLEHRVFQREEQDAFDLFAALGASSNAATSYTSTTYYFSTVENFPECLHLLLGFLDGLHLTPEAVEKEKDIIAEEIRGNQDNPGWVVYQRLMSGMYVKSFARFDILGTLEDISSVDENLLRTAYETFYHPGNTELVVSGDIDPEDLLGEISRLESLFSPPRATGRVSVDEPSALARPVSRVSMEVSQPKILMGFKEKDAGFTGTPLLRRQLETSIGMSGAFGRASEFFDELYARGIIDDSFFATYSAEPGMAFSMFSGDTDQPDELTQSILGRIDEFRRSG